MKFSLRTLLLAFLVLAILLPTGIFLVRINMQPECCISRTFGAQHISHQDNLPAYSQTEALPYINCLTVHEAFWGRPRVVVLHRVTDPLYRSNGRFPDWLADDGYLPIRIVGAKVWAGDSVVVIHAEDGAEPAQTLIGHDEMPLDEPWWPDTIQLWQLVSEQTDVNAG